MFRVCKKCSKEKPIVNFVKNASCRDGYAGTCKDCANIVSRERYKKNPEIFKARCKKWRDSNPDKQREAGRNWRAFNPDKVKEKTRRYAEKNREKLRERQSNFYKNNTELCRSMAKRWRECNQDKVKEYKKNYYQENAEEIKKKSRERIASNRPAVNGYMKNRYANNTAHRLACILRRRLRAALNGETKSLSANELVGCTIEELISHIEKQFHHGMSWDNYGLYGWHIDHIKPCSAFDLTDEKQQRECFNYTNLQPLLAIENIRKGGA